MGISRVNATGEFVYKIKKWNKEYRDSVVEVQFTPRSGNSALPPYLLVPTTISWKSRMSGSPHSMTYLRHHLKSPHCISRRISNTSGTFRDLRSGKKKNKFCKHDLYLQQYRSLDGSTLLVQCENRDFQIFEL